MPRACCRGSLQGGADGRGEYSLSEHQEACSMPEDMLLLAAGCRFVLSTQSADLCPIRVDREVLQEVQMGERSVQGSIVSHIVPCL